MFARVRILLALAALATLAAPAAAAPGSRVQPLRAEAAGASSLASEVLVALNSVRRRRGLMALRLSPALTAAAAAHSHEMAADGYFDHRSADGSPFWKRVERFYPTGHARMWALGENLLWSSPGIDAPTAIQMWMGSPEHKKNMLDPRWREIGLSALHVTAAPGFYQGLEVTLVTADFAVRR
jgi:uncharacterized protein YkwD